MTTTKEKRKPPRAGMGRPKGARNHRTRTLDQMLDVFIDHNLPGAQALYDRLGRRFPGAALRVLTSLIEYRVPKLARSEIHDNRPPPPAPTFNFSMSLGGPGQPRLDSEDSLSLDSEVDRVEISAKFLEAPSTTPTSLAPRQSAVYAQRAPAAIEADRCAATASDGAASGGSYAVLELGGPTTPTGSSDEPATQNLVENWRVAMAAAAGVAPEPVPGPPRPTRAQIDAERRAEHERQIEVENAHARDAEQERQQRLAEETRRRGEE